MSYNDFPILNEQQYGDLSLEYEKQLTPKTNHVQKFIDIIFRCKTSLFFYTQANAELKKCLSNNANSLNNILDTLTLLYPKLKTGSNTVFSNLFLILKELTASLSVLKEIKAQENKKIYINTLNKIEKSITNILSETLSCLSKQNLHFFIHM